MSHKANKTLIGVFVVGAVALAVISVLIFGSGRFFTERLTYVCYFQGSVKGLNVGAPVVFRGVRVGTISDISIESNIETLSIKIPVYIELEPKRFGQTGPSKDPKANLERLIKAGLRAQLELQSLVTGQLMIELDFHPHTPAKMVGNDTGYPEIPTIPSGMEELAKTIEKLPLDQLANKLTAAIAGIVSPISSRCA